MKEILAEILDALKEVRPLVQDQKKLDDLIQRAEIELNDEAQVEWFRKIFGDQELN